MSDTSGKEYRNATDELRDEVSRARFEFVRDGSTVAWMRYKHLKPNRYVLLHTEVDLAHRGHGIGQKFVEAVLDEVRLRGGTITAICPFVADYLSSTENYKDLIDAKHPGHLDGAAAERGDATP